ncbi:MAG: hypothetical protein CVV02_07230 [Firmicutes bacterium HGW-Firmicutes-7]|nr:MAG: hypothetical protein CVV02_07230 [Firmicutes bacterium HGW-Firmicutes-7]
MKNDKQSYFKDDIRRIFLFYAIVPVVLLTFVFLLIFWGSWRYTLEKTNKQDNQRIITDLETTINSYIEVSEKLSQQKNILDSELDVRARVEIFESVYEVSNRLNRKAELYVFDHELKSIISGTKKIPDFLDGNYYANWGVFRIMNQDPEEIALKLVIDEYSDTRQLVIGKTIIKEGVITGYIVFVLDSKQFQVQLANMESQTVITNDYGWVYISNNYTFLNRMNRFDLKGQKTNGNIRNKLGKYYLTSSGIFDNRIQVYSISALGNLASVFWSIIIILLFVFATMILAVFSSTNTMAIKKTKDLYTILKAFEKVKEGDLNTHIEISSNDEWAIIGESYNLMLDSLKEQIDTNKEMGRLVVTSQAKQLESQFNPHFLFNTLENIRFMCKLDAISASKMIFNLSTLLRYSISNAQEEVTVKEDVFYTENYMSILKYRFNQRFHYNIDLPSAVEQCIIPKLIIQPMIENAIKYGFEGKDQLTVKISGYIENSKLVLVCYDDGAGMNAVVLKEIKEIILQNTNKSNHSGLFNIHRRVQLKYGQEYGVQIESELGIGTYSSVVLPVRYKDSRGGQ